MIIPYFVNIGLARIVSHFYLCNNINHLSSAEAGGPRRDAAGSAEAPNCGDARRTSYRSRPDSGSIFHGGSRRWDNLENKSRDSMGRQAEVGRIKPLNLLDWGSPPGPTMKSLVFLPFGRTRFRIDQRNDQ